MRKSFASGVVSMDVPAGAIRLRRSRSSIVFYDADGGIIGGGTAEQDGPSAWVGPLVLTERLLREPLEAV
jgi:hypothetical protein